MKISFWTIGKENDPYVKAGVQEFTKRIGAYFKIQWDIIPLPKNSGMLSQMDLRKKEAEIVLTWLRPEDYLVALDEKGRQWTSEELAKFIQQRANTSVKNLVFLIGGIYGLDASILKQAKQIWSLSPLTFPHQLVRLILAEQVYRACTILNHEKYHHK
ncbi:MAG: 23S rRNA (pseudouridine(1915)-N(3))-methyltransferase RlmH [Bacteroidetes bacterium]|nr:23S rRNA (pseudouridine(1915)-N(3))-methyltransferase RlmH [Bacteroidota bacterium]MBS1631014.1 23S rRNA (pseudouridine(1915)-N(3))-methyltransferase RlmH [Bacteroidota bacterium]